MHEETLITFPLCTKNVTINTRDYAERRMISILTYYEIYIMIITYCTLSYGILTIILYEYMII